VSEYKNNKINRCLLDIIQLVSKMPEDIEKFIENGDQKSVDTLVDKIEDIDAKWDKAKKSTASLIKVVVDPEAPEEDFEITEKGVEF